MNANLAFHALQGMIQTAERITSTPLASDFFAWCRETDTFRHIEWSMSVSHVVYKQTMPLADLKAAVEKRITIEQRKRERGHFTYCPNRVMALKQMVARIEQYQREVA